VSGSVGHRKDRDSWYVAWYDKKTVSPATYKGYQSYVKNHIRPYFEVRKDLMLYDIQLDILTDFMNSVGPCAENKNERAGKISPLPANKIRFHGRGQSR
jgi:hypothetical protein